MDAEKIRPMAREVLALALRTTLPDGEIIREHTPEWDSLRHMELVFLLEDTFGVQFTEAELRDLTSLSTIVDAVERHLAA